MHYLYIIPSADKKTLKIGVSSNDFTRIERLSLLHNLDLKKSIIFESEEGYITAIEKILLNSTINYKISAGENKDGYTEIRDYSCLQEVVEDIEHYKRKFKLKEIKYIKQPIKKRRIKRSSKSDNSKYSFENAIWNIKNIKKHFNIIEVEKDVEHYNTNYGGGYSYIKYEIKCMQINEMDKYFVETHIFTRGVIRVTPSYSAHTGVVEVDCNALTKTYTFTVCLHKKICREKYSKQTRRMNKALIETVEHLYQNNYKPLP